MCKFTNRLFVFVLLAISGIHSYTSGAPSYQHPPAGRFLSDLLQPDYDYDLHYDQRQRGTENLRLKLDGFFIGMPADDSSSLTLITDDLLDNLGEELLLGLGKSRHTTSAPDNTLPNKLESVANKLNSEQKLDSVVVEIPAPKKEFEARHAILQADQEAADENEAGSRTKFHIYNLLNLLRRSRRA